jgi:hypothetical protein
MITSRTNTMGLLAAGWTPTAMGVVCRIAVDDAAKGARFGVEDELGVLATLCGAAAAETDDEEEDEDDEDGCGSVV